MSARYTVLGSLASGGMGTVFLARMAGSAGFSRLVAIKRLLPELAAQKEFVAMLVDEARLASSLHHVNIIDTLDLVASDGAFSLVLEYIEGAALSHLAREASRSDDGLPTPVALTILQGMLRGLDAAHEARSVEGTPLGIVHRDISPQNVLVGVDGVPRIIDFGIAKAMGRVVQTRPGEVRGKFAYMAPEQLLERPATRQSDVYSAGVVLWELLTGERLFTGEDIRAVCAAVVRGGIRPPSTVNPAVPKALDEVVLKATALSTSDRYLTAREFLDDLAQFERASDDDVGRWVRANAAVLLAKRAEVLQNQAPEQSRSLEDLMAELAASGDVPPVSLSPPTAPIEPHVTTQPIRIPSVRSTLPLPPDSARGVTNAAVVVSTRTPSTSKVGPLAAVAAFFAVLAIGLAVLLGGAKKAPPASSTPPLGEMPPPASAFAPPEPEPEAELVPADPLEEPAAAPSASSSHTAPIKRVPKAKPGTPKKPAAPRPDHSFDHP